MILPLLPALVVRLAEDPAPPEGWRSERKGDGSVAYVPKNLPAGALVGFVLNAEEEAPGELEAWLEARAKKMGLPKAKASVAGSVALVSGASGGRPLVVAAVRVGGRPGRARVAVFVADAERVEAYQGAFGAFLIALAAPAPSVRPEPEVATPLERTPPPGSPAARIAAAYAALPVSDPAKPLPPAVAPGLKIFSISRFEWDAGLNAATYHFEPLILLPDGTAFDKAPDAPVAVFDAAHLKAVYAPGDVGRWSVAGGTMTLSFPARKGKDAKTELRKLGEGWTDDPKAKIGDAQDVYLPARPLTRASVQGVWTTTSGFAAGTVFGPISVRTSTRRIGFRGESYTLGTSKFEYMNNDRSESESLARGRFRADGFLLTQDFPVENLNGAGGKARRGVVLAYHLPDDGEKGVYETLALGGAMWVPVEP